MRFIDLERFDFIVDDLVRMFMNVYKKVINRSIKMQIFSLYVYKYLVSILKKLYLLYGKLLMC